jgi:hypothetical protein
LPRTPDSDASELFSDPSSEQSDNRDTPSLEVNREKHGSPCQGKESSSSKPDTPSLPRGVLGSIEPSYHRYHIYRIHRKTTLSWVISQDDQFGASAGDSGSSDCLGDLSDSEYFPDKHSISEGGNGSEDGSSCSVVHASGSEYSEYSPADSRNSEVENESEYGSDKGQVTDWESGSEGESHGTQDVESEIQSQYEVSGDQHGGVQSDESGYGSSDFWDGEVDCYSLSDDSEDEESSDGLARRNNEYDDTFTDARGNAQYLRPAHGYLLKGADIESLRRMALSTITGAEVAELPLMQSLIEKLCEKTIQQWFLGFWNHRQFDPEPCGVREILVRDLNTCLVLSDGGGDISRATKVDLTFDELRRSNFEETLGLLSEHGYRDLPQRVCENLIRLTRAPHCLAILSYIGVEDNDGLWSQLGEQALGYLYYKD